MRAVEIPIKTQEPHFSQEHDIFGRNYYLEFEWIESEQFWLLHLGYSSTKPLNVGIRLQPNWPLYQNQSVHLMLIARQKAVNITRTNLETDFSLVCYVPAL